MLQATLTLCRGAEHAFAAAAFSVDGRRLPTAGSARTYTLTVWDWQVRRPGRSSVCVDRCHLRLVVRARLPGAIACRNGSSVYPTLGKNKGGSGMLLIRHLNRKLHVYAERRG